MIAVKDPSFDYRFFDRSFLMRKNLWHPDRPREAVEGYDIKKMITEKIEFVDSRNEILIQAVDVIASFLRRLLAREIVDDHIARALGRLQIYREHDGGEVIQSLRVLTLSRSSEKRTSFSRDGLAKTLRIIGMAGRNMLIPERSRPGRRIGK
jgi:hypothetical protein